MLYAKKAFRRLIKDYDFLTVLDIGCGSGRHTKLFEEHGKKVTPISLRPVKDMDIIIGDYNYTTFEDKFDCIWACAVLEHQHNINFFLKKVYNDLKEDGVLCITVPPLKHEIVAGHVSLWNAGLLVYNLIIAKFNCKDIRIKEYGYCISIILKKKTIEQSLNLTSDMSEFESLEDFAPDFFKHNFNGDIKEYNWIKNKVM